MIHTTHTIRVRYGETDAMKYVYYGNYAAYFEVARVELFRSLGMSYDEIEKEESGFPFLIITFGICDLLFMTKF